MKKCISMILMSIIVSLHANTDNEFAIAIEPHWQDIDSNNYNHAERFGGKWILVGSITFKKKAKDPVNLTRLYLHWNGAPLDTLAASLYREAQHKQFLPLEDFLMCDGTWNRLTQTLMLDFEKQESLGLANTFHLVLTVPSHLEQTIKHGSFTIVKNRLPDPFQVAMSPHILSFASDVA